MPDTPLILAAEVPKTFVLKMRNSGTVTTQTGAPPVQNFRTLSVKLGSRLFRGFG